MNERLHVALVWSGGRHKQVQASVAHHAQRPGQRSPEGAQQVEGDEQLQLGPELQPLHLGLHEGAHQGRGMIPWSMVGDSASREMARMALSMESEWLLPLHEGAALGGEEQSLLSSPC
jgi:hypothetical protein